MNWYFVAAGGLTVIVGSIHSAFGERLIFRRMRSGGIVPANGGAVLPAPHVRILWASWHLVTAMGMGQAAVLFWLALPSSASVAQPVIAMAIIGAMVAGASLVLFATKGKHPGWAGLLGVAVLTAMGWFR